jgi:hypothetical protein
MSADMRASHVVVGVSEGYRMRSGQQETLVLGVGAGVRAGAARLARAVWTRRGGLFFYAGVVLIIAWLVGLHLFLRVGAHSPVIVSLPGLKPHPAGVHNLVDHSYGVQLRASSYFRDRIAQHHPAFLVDGRAQPSLVEKWASDPTDAKPWVELLWTGERGVERVRIQHAGAVESAEYTVRRYVLTCLSPRAPLPVVVRDNEAAEREHDLRCQGARGLRIDFTPNSPGALVRIFEVEVWGR